MWDPHYLLCHYRWAPKIIHPYLLIMVCRKIMQHVPVTELCTQCTETGNLFPADKLKVWSTTPFFRPSLLLYPLGWCGRSGWCFRLSMNSALYMLELPMKGKKPSHWFPPKICAPTSVYIELLHNHVLTPVVFLNNLLLDGISYMFPNTSAPYSESFHTGGNLWMAGNICWRASFQLHSKCCHRLKTWILRTNGSKLIC